jgi:hypothetical protein
MAVSSLEGGIFYPDGEASELRVARTWEKMSRAQSLMAGRMSLVANMNRVLVDGTDRSGWPEDERAMG